MRQFRELLETDSASAKMIDMATDSREAVGVTAHTLAEFVGLTEQV
jgi:hypothetical protein